jgi:ABC-2 type transport system permease protein
VSHSAYLRFELLRTFRNRRILIFSLGFPLVLYLVIAGPNRDERHFSGTGLSAPLYYMVSLAAWGTMSAMLGSGARIAAERQVGWNRQLRITPLTPRTYFRAKVVSAYVLAGASIALLYVVGASFGVSMPVGTWVRMTALVLVGLLPFAALGILLGHLLTADSVGPAVGGITAVLALVSGIWFPIGQNSTLHDIAQFLPSYWLVQAGHVGIGGHGWGAEGWIVIAVWTVGLTLLARRAYARDTKRF